MTGTDARRRVAVVSAGAGGMGREISLQLAGRGIDVVAADCDMVALGELASAAHDLPGMLLCQQCDIARAGDVAALAELVRSRYGQVDLLFNHAGVSAAGGFDAIPFSAWERLVSVNLLGTVRMMQAFVPMMIERGVGHIVNTASTLALFLDSPWHAPYLATKAAVIAMSRSAELQYAEQGLRISVFCPDLTDTGFHRFSSLHGLTLDEFRAKVAPSARQDAAIAVRALLDQLDAAPFLISMAPSTPERMHSAVDDMLTPRGAGVISSPADSGKTFQDIEAGSGDSSA